MRAASLQIGLKSKPNIRLEFGPHQHNLNTNNNRENFKKEYRLAYSQKIYTKI